MFRKVLVFLVVGALHAMAMPAASAMVAGGPVSHATTSTEPIDPWSLQIEPAPEVTDPWTLQVEPAPEPIDPWTIQIEAESAVATVEDAAEGAAEDASDAPITFEEFRIPDATMQQITQEWLDEIVASHPAHSWAPLEFHPTDSQLDRMGLPSSDILLAQRYPEPTMISKTGQTETVDISPINHETGTLGPTAPPFAGAGWFGIRPGAKVLLLNGGSVGWCTLAHVYGSPGSYSISTAGHCGKAGDIATVVAAFGNRNGVLNPVLLDFGVFKTSHDGGLGNDWALISVNSAWQNLVSPTMAFWGGPRGMYTKTGAVAGITFPRRGLVPSVTLNPDPLLAQSIVHYGHGTGVGTGGTPRAGLALYWGTSHYMFEGVITFGDSGSGSNAIVGDTVGGSMEAAGINTHIWVDPLMRSGIGIMGGTRATQVSGTLANGQIVSYPVPVTGAP